MEMKIVGVTIATFVSLVVLAAVLMPILDDATATTDVLTNDGYGRYTAIASTDTDTVVITWDHTKPTKLDINGDEITINAPSGGTLSLVFANNFNMRYNTTGPAVDVYGTVGNTVSASVSDSTDVTITLSAGTASVANTKATPDTATYSYTTAYCPSDDGEYVMKYQNSTAYVNPESTIIVANGMTIVGNRIGVYFDGTIDDGYTFNYFNTSATVTATNVVSDYSDVAEYEDVVSLSKITMHLTKGADEVDATYSYFLVPHEITAERAQHLSGNEIALLATIPVLIIVAILLGVVALIVRSRMD